MAWYNDLYKSWRSGWGLGGQPSTPAMTQTKGVGYTGKGYVGGPNYPVGGLPTIPDVTTPSSGMGSAEYWNTLNARLKAIEDSFTRTQRPRPTFGATREAYKGEAERETNPYYAKLLTQYLEGVRIKREREQADYETSKKQFGTERGYTEEDFMRGTTSLGEQKQEYRQGERAQAVSARQNLLASLAGAGLTFSGLGQEQVRGAEAGRRLESKAQARQFKEKGEGLGISKERGLTAIGEREKGRKLSLDRFLQDIEREEGLQKETLEEERKRRVEEYTTDLFKGAFENWAAKTPGALGW